MTIDQFAAITLRIIESDGFADYLPTACYPETKEIVVLEGYPDPIVPGEVVRQWAADRGKPTPYLIAFKLDAERFQIDLIDGPRSASRVFEVGAP